MNAADVFELVKKNLKNLIRAKTGSLVIILGPLIVIFLAGLAFDNSNAYAVKIGTYMPEPTEITTKFLDQLRSQFKVSEYKTEEDCVNAIKNTDINTCMSFSPAFAVGKPPQNKITFYVDYSRINLVYSIMQVMTQKIGEKTLQESQSLTKLLIDTLDFTQNKINDEREVIVKLTTENELINKNIRDLQAELGDMSLAFDEKGFALENITSAKTQVKQWIESSLSISEKGLSKATSFIDAANLLVKSSSAAQETKDNLLASFQKSVDEITTLKSTLAENKNLTKESFERFDKQINELANTISRTKTSLQEADAGRQLGLRVLEAVTILLDKSLLSISDVQQALNDIENRINAIEIKDPEAVTQPIVTNIKPVVQEKTHLNYLFPILSILIIMFTALLITPTLILLDKNSPASFRTYMTPVADSSYVLANFITASLILFLQTIIVLAIASVFFTGQIIANIPEALLILIIMNSVFILIGMIVGYSFNSEEGATLGAVSIGAIFLFISDVIIPLESMPEAFAYMASFNPYVLGSQLLRRALIFDQSLLTMLGDIFLLLGYIVALALLATGIYLLTRRYSMQQLGKAIAPVFARVRFKKR